jgi:hypothetical protein
MLEHGPDGGVESWLCREFEGLLDTYSIETKILCLGDVLRSDLVPDPNSLYRRTYHEVNALTTKLPLVVLCDPFSPLGIKLNEKLLCRWSLLTVKHRLLGDGRYVDRAGKQWRRGTEGEE